KLAIASTATHRDDNQIIECRDRVRLRPKPNPSGGEAAIAMTDEKLIVQPALDVITLCRDAQFMPLAERRSLDTHTGDLMAAAVVIVQIEVVLQSIGPDDVITAFGEAEDDAGGGVLAPRNGFEPHRNINIGIRSARCHDHVESIVCRALNQRLSL